MDAFNIERTISLLIFCLVTTAKSYKHNTDFLHSL